MKKTLALVAALTVVGGTASCFGAATVLLNNYDANFPILFNGANAPVDGTYIQLIGGPVGGTLAPVTQAKPGSTASVFGMTEPGFFDSEVGVVPGVTSGDAQLQLIAWRGSADLASATDVGRSAVWTQSTGSWDPAAQPPAAPTGPAMALPGSFTIVATVPEPSTLALGVLGAAALLIRRRK